MNLAKARLAISERLFYVASAMIVLVVALLVVLLIVTRIQNNNQNQKIQTLLTQQGQDTDKIGRQVSCLGTYLAREDRARLTITDFDKCTFRNNADGTTGTLTVTTVFTPATPAGSASTPGSAPTADQGGDPAPGTPSNPTPPVVTPPPAPQPNLLQKAGSAIMNTVDNIKEKLHL